MNINSRLGKYRDNIRGWRTARKLIIFESDDWGSIRMPSTEVYQKCIQAGYPVDKTVYERYDSLMSSDDLELLFSLLSQFKDKNGSHPVITANCVVANPDFEKIREGNFQTYYYELITDTFKKYPKHQGNFVLWQKGLSEGIFFPQFHAREHLNVNLFMGALRTGNPDILFAFNCKMPGIVQINGVTGGNRFVEATHYHTQVDKDQKLENILEGLDLFEDIFGYRSDTIVPTNYIWSPDFNKQVQKKGIKAFQGQRRMIEPVFDGIDKTHYHHLGQRNELGQLHLIRNVIFEPASMKKMGITDPTDSCLSDISIAFRLRKPAIICSHRVNYVGYLDENNRDKTLKMLDALFKRILKEWPEAEFMTSSQLTELILND